MYVILAIYYLGMFFLVNNETEPVLFTLEYCMNSNEQKPVSIKLSMFLMIPVNGSGFLNVFYDVRTYFHIKNHVFPVQESVDPSNQMSHQNARLALAAPYDSIKQGQNISKSLEIPLKATVISSVIAFTSLAIAIMVSRIPMSNSMKAQLLWSFTLVLGIFRNPVISTVVFRSNEINRQAYDP